MPTLDAKAPPSPKIRRALELVYSVEGVVAARIWHWGGRIVIGVRGAGSTSPTDLLRRVEIAVAGLRDPGEEWDFGVLEYEPSSPALQPEPPEGERDRLSSPRRSLRSPF